MGNARPQVMPNDAWVVANDTRLQLSSPKCRVRDLSAACKIPVAIIRTTPSNNALLPQDALICAGDQLCIVSNRSVDDPCITVPIALIGAYLTTVYIIAARRPIFAFCRAWPLLCWIYSWQTQNSIPFCMTRQSKNGPSS